MDQKVVKAGAESLLILEKLEGTQPYKTPENILEWTCLDFDNGGVNSIPNSINWCVNVRKIYAQNNKLSSLPGCICDLHHLREVWLAHNQFTEFPSSACEAKLLELLDLTYNQIAKIPRDINKMSSLKYLYLSNNNLSDFPSELCRIKCLEELQLDNNQLSDIPSNVNQMKNLLILELRGNKFTSVPEPLCTIPNLEKLYMENNAISFVPPSISNLENLDKLQLDKNKISHLPAQMVKAKNLKDIHLNENPLAEPPESVCMKGIEAIKRYFSELKDSKAVETSVIQVNLLGETESGKSSVSLSLKRGEPTLTDIADRTRVISQLSCETDSNIAFNINDFGGHDVYKVSHPFFISKNGMVLITFNLVTYDPDNYDHYTIFIGDWIDKVQAQTVNMNIALLGTHLDELKDKERAYEIRDSILERIRLHMDEKTRWLNSQVSVIDERIEELSSPDQDEIIEAYREKQRRLRRAANQITDVFDKVFLVSSKTMEGFDELKKYLSQQARKFAVTIPVTWKEASNAVRVKKYDEGSKNTLHWDDLQEIISQHAPKTWQKRSAAEKSVVVCDILSFLASRGDIIWFDASHTLARVIFHKQTVLANLLKAVLTHNIVHFLTKLEYSRRFSKQLLEDTRDDYTVRGILSKRVMRCLWEEFHLSSAEVDFMVELLQQLELCYPVDKGSSVSPDVNFHFPWLLKDDRHEEVGHKWPSKVPSNQIQVTLEVYFPYRCPDGMFEKFSVRQHNYLGGFKSRRMDWKDGLFSEIRSCRIQISRIQRESDWVVVVAVRGRDVEDLWPPLHRAHYDLMNIINQDWPGVSYDKRLVCPHCVKEGFSRPELFPGELLDRAPPIGGSDADYPCRNSDELIDAALVYPATKAELCRNVLVQNRELLIENITDSCLRDILNTLEQEEIITKREVETVKTEPEPPPLVPISIPSPTRKSSANNKKMASSKANARGSSANKNAPRKSKDTQGAAVSDVGSTTRVVSLAGTAVLLDILGTRSEKALSCLCDCLERNNQQEIVAKLQSSTVFFPRDLCADR